MSSSQLDIRGLQSKADESVLETLKQNLQHVKAAFDAEKVTFEAARARFERAKEALVAAQSRLDGYTTIVSEQRNKIRRIPALEPEILCSIFEAACPPHIIDAWVLARPTSVSSMKQRLAAPFRISAVCKRWRTVATALGSLWNLIAIPEDGDDSERASRTIAYIATVAKRSQSVGLAVIIDWEEVEDVDERDGCTRMIAALAPHLQRVVTLEIHVGRCGAWMNLLRRPTPQLVTLFCSVAEPSDAWDDAPLPRYLPIAPKLQTLHLKHVPLVPQAPLPALSQLDIELAFVPSDIITKVFINAPALVDVQLTFLSVDVVEAPGTRLSVIPQCLTNLNLLHAAVCVFSQPTVAWQFPRVTWLTLDAMQIDAAHEVLAMVNPTLSALVLDGPGVIEESTADVLRHLAKLQELEFTSCTVTDDFWRALCKTEEIILPALASVTLDNVDLAEDDEGNSDNGDGLVYFVRERRRGSSTTVGDVTPLKTVDSVVIKRHGTLDVWLVEEIRYIMSSSM